MQRLTKCACLQGDVVELAQHHDVDLVIVGPEKPLVNGLADKLMCAQYSSGGTFKKCRHTGRIQDCFQAVYASGWDSDSEMHLARWCRECVAGIGRLDCDRWGGD